MTNKTLSWNDRFALIDAFEPTDEQIIQAFGVAKTELDAARQMREFGTFAPTRNLDVEAYKDIFGGSGKNSLPTTPSITRKPADPNAPVTATKPIRQPKKRGRNGSNIVNAFSKIPTSPVPAESFAKENSISLAVLRQSKRFDPMQEAGRVRVKQDDQTKVLMVWREKEEEKS